MHPSAKDSFTLNENQWKSAAHVEGPLLILAGAGSGKTRVVTARIAHLLSLGIPSSEILAVTFTNKAADEMRKRVASLSNQTVLTCTFHSLCCRILRESISYLGYKNTFTILDEEDSEKVVKESLKELGIKDEKAKVKQVRSFISSAKNQMLNPFDLTDDQNLISLYERYQAKLKEYNAVDFDDLLYLTVLLFQKHPEVLELYQKRWSFVLIDEYQDTNHSQHTIAKALVAKTGNIFAVGDPDQSIYSWRGANIQNILNFSKDFPNAQVITLDQNYRSTNTILQAANAIIQNNSQRYEKKLWSELGDGEKIGVYLGENEHAEVDFVLRRLRFICSMHKIPLKDCVIFYRTNFQSRSYEDALLKEGIPYEIIGGLSFYQRREIKDVLSFLRLVLSENDFISFARVVNLPKRGIGPTTLDKMRLYASEKSLGILSLCKLLAYDKIDVGISEKQKTTLIQFAELVEDLRSSIQNLPVSESIAVVIEKAGYFNYLKEDPETFEERRDNLSELITKAIEWEKLAETPTLASFLEELTLKSSATETETDDKLKLMTLHNGKGLEFELVFIVGLEEDVFPHINCKNDVSSLEEERRLFYVGVTRAKRFLYLTAASYRFLWGAPRIMQLSRFFSEIPSKFTESHNMKASIPCSVKHIPLSSSLSIPEGEFAPGQAVLHKDFGYGIVQKKYTTSLGTTYDVLFIQSNSQKSLVAKYAKLTLAE